MRLSLTSLLLAFDLRIGRDDDTDTVSAVAGSPWTADATIAPTFDALAQVDELPGETPQDGVHRMSEAHAPALTEALHTLRDATVADYTPPTPAAREPETMDCTHCHGTGKVKKPCSLCGDTGLVVITGDASSWTVPCPSDCPR